MISLSKLIQNMDFDHFVPAISENKEKKKELSVTDFQKGLMEWFNKRGLLNDLRAHLRAQMVHALKDSSSNKCFASKNISPKKQAFNLLVAEFLMLYNYHYSLSVFSTEVPFTNVLQSFTSHGGKCDNNNKKVFKKEDAIDILETVGISRHSKECNAILKKYFSTKTEPLLINILRCLVDKMHFISTNNVDLILEELKNCFDDNSWENKVRNFFSNRGFDEISVDSIIFFISGILAKERHKIELVCEDKIQKMREEYDVKENEIIKKAEMEKIEHKNKFENFKQKLKVLREKEVLTMRKHLTQISDFENKLKKEKEEIKIQQKELIEKHKLLENAFTNLKQERQAVQGLKEKLNDEKKNVIKLRKILENERLIESSSPNKLSVECPEKNNCKMNIRPANFSNLKVINQSSQQNKNIQQLDVENKKMKKKIYEQKEKIQELSTKISTFLMTSNNSEGKCDHFDDLYIYNNPFIRAKEKSNKISEEYFKSTNNNKSDQSNVEDSTSCSEKVIKEAKAYLAEVHLDTLRMNKSQEQLELLLLE